MNVAPPLGQPPGAGAAAQRPAAASQTTEQMRYARWLEWGTRIGLVLLLLSFAVYLSGLLPSHVPRRHLPELWTLPVGEYLRQTGTPGGWGWLALAAHGDVANLLGISVLAGCSLPPLLALVPLYAARGERIYAGLCLAEVGVLLLAASGVIGAGH